jgi:uncharacterized protein (DUF736 family)
MSNNIGELTKNANGFYTGKLVTRDLFMVIALREVNSANPNAPRFEIFEKASHGAYVKVGALWEQIANGTGEAFLQGSVDDPSMDKPLAIACFMRDDGSYAIAWSRPKRSNAMPASPTPSDGDDEGQGAIDFNGDVSAPPKSKARRTADLGETTSDALVEA